MSAAITAAVTGGFALADLLIRLAYMRDGVANGRPVTLADIDRLMGDAQGAYDSLKAAAVHDRPNKAEVPETIPPITLDINAGGSK